MAVQRTRIFGWCEPSSYCRKHGLYPGWSWTTRRVEMPNVEVGAAMDREPRML